MDNKLKIAGLLAGGYILGRSKKLKLALTVASSVAGVAGYSKRQMLSEAITKISENTPELQGLTDKITGRLAESGKNAAYSMVSMGVDQLSQKLQEQTDKINDSLDSPAQTSAESAEESEEDESAEAETEEATEEEPADDEAEEDPAEEVPEEEPAEDDEQEPAEDEAEAEPSEVEAQEPAEDDEAAEEPEDEAQGEPEDEAAEEETDEAPEEDPAEEPAEAEEEEPAVEEEQEPTQKEEKASNKKLLPANVPHRVVLELRPSHKGKPERSASGPGRMILRSPPAGVLARMWFRPTAMPRRGDGLHRSSRGPSRPVISSMFPTVFQRVSARIPSTIASCTRGSLRGRKCPRVCSCTFCAPSKQLPPGMCGSKRP